MSSGNGKLDQSKHYIPSDLLDDLCCRFIINLPYEERWNILRVCFHVEMAHWFYLDNYCKMYKLRPCGQRKFAAHIFQHIPDFRRYYRNLDTVLEHWREYKRSIPTYGAILFDEDLSHVLLVQSYHVKTWGFPKGKVYEDEEPWNCATREVLEETGFDISKLINKREYIEATINGRTIRLYIVPYIPRDTNFKPLTQKEIKACVWFPIDDLPSNKKEMKQKVKKMSVSHKKFSMLTPFIKQIRRWISVRNRYEEVKSTRSTHQQSTSTDKIEIGISQELQDAFRKYQQKNFPTQEPQNVSQYQLQDLQELEIACMKYLQRNQPTQKLDMLDMLAKNQQQNLRYYEYQDGQLYQVQNSPMTANNILASSTNTSENNLSNLEKYYQQDLPTQQLKNALMIHEKQEIPYIKYQKRHLDQELCSPNNSRVWSKNTSENDLSGNESKLATGIRLLKPSDFLSVEKES